MNCDVERMSVVESAAIIARNSAESQTINEESAGGFKKLPNRELETQINRN